MKEAWFYRVIRPIVIIIFKVLYRPIIIGKENIPKKGRVILAGNHTGIYDCAFLISSTKRCVHFLAKDELWKGPKKIIFSNIGLIPVNRRIKDKSVIPMSVKYLNNEKLIGIFPEGTFSPDPEKMLPFKMGVIKIAKESGAPIVPFRITGKYRRFSKGVKIVYGKPYYVTSEEMDAEKEKLYEIISNLK